MLAQAVGVRCKSRDLLILSTSRYDYSEELLPN
jgi:hypothetical protein